MDVPRFLLTLLVLGLPSVAYGWPPGWVSVPVSNSPLSDVLGDGGAEAPSLDLVGPATLQRHVDGDELALRWATGAQGPGPEGSRFEVVVELDGDLTTWERKLTVQGLTIASAANSGGAGWEGVAGDPESLPLSEEPVRYVVDEGGQAWVEVVIPRVEALEAWGLGGDEPYRLAIRAVGEGFEDVAGCQAAVGLCPDLEGLWSSTLWIDQDLDGASDPQELRWGGNTNDSDSDNDGVPDGIDWGYDEDGDGWRDLVDCDSDNDWILDGTELGLTAADVGPESFDGGWTCFVADQDPSTTTRFWVWDEDGGGLADGLEDGDRDGKFEPPWESDPRDASDDADSDGDGLADVVELAGWDGEVIDEDSDQDGLPDWQEWIHDPDLDGIPAFIDDDSDGDGLPDEMEGAEDPDQDGWPAFLDTDSDGDGLLDQFEGEGDGDGDGKPNRLDRDSDGDGKSDGAEGVGDVDCDGIVDWLDRDSDDSFCSDAGDPPGQGSAELPVVDLPPSDRSQGAIGGSSCDQSGLGASGGLALVAMALVRRRRAAVVAGTLAAGVARAEEGPGADAQGLRPVPDGGGFVTIPALRTGWGLRGGASLFFTRAARPLVYNRPGGEPLALVESVSTAQLGLYGGMGPLQVALGMPVHVETVGYGVDQPVNAGDVWLGARVTAWKTEGQRGMFQVGPSLTGWLPTGAPRSWVGTGALGGSAEVVVNAKVFAKSKLDEVGGEFAGRVGVRSGSGTEIHDQVMGPAVIWAAGAGYRVDEHIRLGVEARGEHLWVAPTSTPTEAFGTLGLSGWGWSLTGGAGAGLSPGVGSPAWRAMAGLTWNAAEGHR